MSNYENLVSDYSTVLNFNVIGSTTEPENPSKNTIWVITDTIISSWIFSATEPSEHEAGLVWIRTGTSSVAEFNAVKEHAMQVYPVEANLYENGYWVPFAAKLWGSSSWVNFSVWERNLYSKGKFITECSLMPPTRGELYYKGYVQLKTVAKTISYNYMVLGPVSLDDIYNINVGGYFADKSGGSHLFTIYVAQTNDAKLSEAVLYSTFNNEGKVTNEAIITGLDVSSLTGDYYIYVGTHTNGGKWVNTRKLNVTNVNLARKSGLYPSPIKPFAEKVNF